METEVTPTLKKVVEYKDSARLIESLSKAMDVNNGFIQKLIEQMIESAADSGQAQQQIFTKLIEGFNKSAEMMTASYRDNVADVNQVFEQRLQQNQKDVRFPKFFSILNKNKWSKKAWNHAFEDYTEHLGVIGQAHQRYNESLALGYAQLATSCRKLFNPAQESEEHEQKPELKGNPMALLTGMIVDAAKERGMIR